MYLLVQRPMQKRTSRRDQNVQRVPYGQKTPPGIEALAAAGWRQRSIQRKPQSRHRHHPSRDSGERPLGSESLESRVLLTTTLVVNDVLHGAYNPSDVTLRDAVNFVNNQPGNPATIVTITGSIAGLTTSGLQATLSALGTDTLFPESRLTYT